MVRWSQTLSLTHLSAHSLEPRLLLWPIHSTNRNVTIWTLSNFGGWAFHLQCPHVSLRYIANSVMGFLTAHEGPTWPASSKKSRPGPRKRDLCQHGRESWFLPDAENWISELTQNPLEEKEKKAPLRREPTITSQVWVANLPPHLPTGI